MSSPIWSKASKCRSEIFSHSAGRVGAFSVGSRTGTGDLFNRLRRRIVRAVDDQKRQELHRLCFAPTAHRVQQGTKIEQATQKVKPCGNVRVVVDIAGILMKRDDAASPGMSYSVCCSACLYREMLLMGLRGRRKWWVSSMWDERESHGGSLSVSAFPLKFKLLNTSCNNY